MNHSRQIKFRVWSKKDKIWLNWFELENNLLFYCQREQLFDVVEFIGSKDCAGKEIYEGDILAVSYFDEIENKKRTNIVEVIFDSSYASFTAGGFALWVGFGEVTYKIVGNIYESPELLN